jgi:hypothetical protein
LLKAVYCLLLVSSLVVPSTAQNPGQAVQGTIQRDGTGEPIADALVSLTVPGITDAVDSMMNLAASFGLPPQRTR